MIKKNYALFGLCIVILALIIYKIPYLNLSYYWDEAWSYKPAVEEMVKHGPSLLPGSISIANYKGHPLFFYFLSSVWLHLFPDNIFWSKCFALSIAVLTLIYTFLLTKYLSNNRTAALFSVILLASQDIFLAQSGLLLPEMLLALLSLMSLYYYFKNKYWFYFVSASLLMLTKETGIILIISILFSDIIYFRIEKKGDFRQYFTTKYPLYLVFIPVSAFFIYQKIKIGWFFYPEHIGYIDFTNNFFHKLNGYFSFLFIFQGRNVTFFSVIIILIYAVIKTKRRIITKKSFTLLIFILFFLLFLSINFYSTRYILSLIPIFSILSIWAVFTCLKNKYFSLILGFVFVAFNLTYGATHFNDSDANIGYKYVVQVQQKMVEYCEDQHLYNKKIATCFLMKTYLTDTLCGYLSSRKIFHNIQSNIDKNTDYIIVSSNEQNGIINRQMDTLSVNLLKIFSRKQAWCKLYQINSKK